MVSQRPRVCGADFRTALRDKVAPASCEASFALQMCGKPHVIHQCACTCSAARVDPAAAHRCTAEDDAKVIAITPGGRRQFLRILKVYMARYHAAGVVNAWHIWENGRLAEDVAYMQELNASAPWITLVPFPYGIHDKRARSLKGWPHGIKLFWDTQRHVTTCGVRIRFDDDIVWADSPARLSEFLDATRRSRGVHPVLYANTINNPLWAWAQQDPKTGTIPNRMPRPAWPPFHRFGMNSLWRRGDLAARVHRLALKEGPGYFRSSRDVEIGWGRYSINCIAWLGESLRPISWGAVKTDEEFYLTHDFPSDANSSRGNLMHGGFVVAHFAFGPQKEYLEKEAAPVLAAYAALAGV